MYYERAERYISTRKGLKPGWHGVQSGKTSLNILQYPRFGGRNWLEEPFFTFHEVKGWKFLKYFVSKFIDL